MIRKVFKIVSLAASFVVMLLFLLTCLTPFLSPQSYWFIGFCGLMAPHLIMLLLLSIIFWLIAKPKLALLPVITLLIGYKQIKTVFAFHIKESFVKEKKANSIRIIDWNVQSLLGLSKSRETKKHVKENIVTTILDLQPDIICMQEFNNKPLIANNISLFSNTYPYYFFSEDYIRKNGYQSGCIIFSKYPIIRSHKIKYPVAESLIYTDVVKGKDTIRIYTTHLQSLKFKKQDYDDIEKIKQQEEDALPASKNIVYKMQLAFKRRAQQTDIITDEITQSPYPSVICGDFNDVPNSYTYFHIKGNRQDAFLKKSFGIGRTFNSLALTLRIDYILPSINFTVHQFGLVDEGLSDHTMLVSDISLNK
jgi:endonuclease/exonuclease/phosphatase family metal-dependent hydrolase